LQHLNICSPHAHACYITPSPYPECRSSSDTGFQVENAMNEGISLRSSINPPVRVMVCATCTTAPYPPCHVIGSRGIPAETVRKSGVCHDNPANCNQPVSAVRAFQAQPLVFAGSPSQHVQHWVSPAAVPCVVAVLRLLHLLGFLRIKSNQEMFNLWERRLEATVFSVVGISHGRAVSSN